MSRPFGARLRFPGVAACDEKKGPLLWNVSLAEVPLWLSFTHACSPHVRSLRSVSQAWRS